MKLPGSTQYAIFERLYKKLYSTVAFGPIDLECRLVLGRAHNHVEIQGPKIRNHRSSYESFFELYLTLNYSIFCGLYDV